MPGAARSSRCAPCWRRCRCHEPPGRFGGDCTMSAVVTLNPITHARKQFRQWWQTRLPLSDTTTLTQRNVYILPTRPGFMLGATLVVLLVASINYQLNLGYLLTFLLAGCVAVGMHVCHGTLRGLSMNLMAPD